MSRMCAGFVLLAVWLGARPASAEHPAGARSLYGLVIGYNESDQKDVTRLRYADDDAVRNSELLRELGAEVVLLAELDEDTRRLYPLLPAVPPTRQALDRAVDTLAQRMQEDEARGAHPVLYLFYSGHGDVDHNEGHLNLSGGRLKRSELLTLLRKLKAGDVHLVVDACKSYFVVFERGVGGRSKVVSGPLIDDSTRLPRNVGVFLSTSSAAESHEWEAYQAGIFSHEIRSALRGGADADGDLRITYEEAASFIWKANAAIPNPKYRPEFFARDPGETAKPSRRTLVDLSGATGDWVRVAQGNPRHFYIESGLGVRVLDVHPGAKSEARLLIPKNRPLYLRDPRASLEAELPTQREVLVAELSLRPTTVKSRGAEHVAFALLFSEPFDERTVQDFQEQREELERSLSLWLAERRDWSPYRRALAISVPVLVASGVIMMLFRFREEDFNRDPARASGDVRSSNRLIVGLFAGEVTAYSLAGAALASYLVWTYWPEKKPASTVEIQFLPAPSGAALSVRW